MAAPELLAVLVPQFIGIIFNYLLFGVFIVQLYLYVTFSIQDPLPIKLFVYTIAILDTVQTGFLTDLSYGLLVTRWGDVEGLAHRPWTALTLLVVNGLVAAMIQIFFSWRIWVLSGKKLWSYLLSGFIVIVALIQCLAAIISGARSAVISKTVSPIETVIAIFPGCVVWLAGSLLCDLIITVSMFLLLTRSRRGTPFRRTEDLLTRMINLTLETGLATTIVAALELSLLVARPYEEFHEAPGYALGKLYSNALLATLNARHLRHASEEVSDISMSIRSASSMPGRRVLLSDDSDNQAPAEGKRSGGVVITTQTWKDAGATAV
ncbi:hypothetical protein EV715DRAFT_296468 [Schizophyllum commune]